MQAYADLAETEQVALLRAVAAEALPTFGLEGGVVTPVLHASNSTYRVDRDGASLRTRDGAWWTGVPSDGFGRTAIVTVAGWLDGTAIDGDLDEPTARMLGAAMARMHVHAAEWQVPDGTALPVFDDVLFGDRDALLDVDDLTAEARDVLDTARARSQAVLTRLHAVGGVRPLHADLHSGNLLRSDDGLQLLDFDDAGLGVSSTTASLRAHARTYLDTAVLRLAAWLETGTFTRRVD